MYENATIMEIVEPRIEVITIDLNLYISNMEKDFFQMVKDYNEYVHAPSKYRIIQITNNICHFPNFDPQIFHSMPARPNGFTRAVRLGPE